MKGHVLVVKLDECSSVERLVAEQIFAKVFTSSAQETSFMSVEEVRKVIGKVQVDVCVIISGLPKGSVHSEVKEFLQFLRSTPAGAVPTVIVTTRRMDQQEIKEISSEIVSIISIAEYGENTITAVMRNILRALLTSATE